MPFNPFDGLFGQGQKQNENAGFDIGGTAGIGFSGDYSQQIKDALNKVTQQQLDESTAGATEASAAGGDFNPALSKFYATKGARDSKTKGALDAVGKAREDEYNRFNVMNSINNYKLNKGYLDLQNEMYQDQKPGTLDDILGGLSSAAGFLSFLRKGGKVGNAKVDKVMKEFAAGKLKSSSGQKVTDHKQAIAIALSEAGLSKYADGGGVVIPTSDYFHMFTGGYIPESAINSAPAETGDNVKIMAKDGERIMSPEAESLTGGHLQMVNDAVNSMMKGFGKAA
jgi:hypothetical protein